MMGLRRLMMGLRRLLKQVGLRPKPGELVVVIEGRRVQCSFIHRDGAVGVVQ